MMIKNSTLIVLLLVSFHTCFAKAMVVPKNVSIKFTGPAGTSCTMKFDKIGKQYNIIYNFDVPLYKIVYHSKGYISQSDHLSTQKFTDSRNGNIASSTVFNYPNQTVQYGKVGQQKNSRMIGNSYDIISLPWEISFNPDLILNTFQITNGRNIYLIQAGNTPISTIKKNKHIFLSKRNVPIDVYDLKLIKGSKNPIQFGYSKQHQNLPVYIKFKNNLYDVEFIATSITVDGKRIL